MIIRGWHIDGFGIFHDERVDDIGPDMTVFYGPNEAGKSTLMAFLSGVLFGFPDPRSKDPQYPPLKGGKHGGRVFIEEAGERYIVERFSGYGRSPRLLDGDGNEVAEGGIQRLLGGADANLFRNVYAFSLSELQRLDTLTAEGIREVIFSSGIAGAGRPARQAIRHFKEAADRISDSPGASTSIKLLTAERQKIDERLAIARAAAGGYGARAAAELAAAGTIEDAKAAAIAAREGLRTARNLTELWPAWCTRRDALAELERIGTGGRTGEAEGAPYAASTHMAEEIEALASEIEPQRSRLATIGAKTDALHKVEAECDGALNSLGADWTGDRIRDFEISSEQREEVRRWYEKLSAARQNAEAGERGATDAAKQLEGLDQRFETAQKGLDADQAAEQDRISVLEEKLQKAQGEVERQESELHYLGSGQSVGDGDDGAKKLSLDERLEAARAAEQEGQRKYAAAMANVATIEAGLEAARQVSFSTMDKDKLKQQVAALEQLHGDLTEFAEQSRKVESMKAVNTALEYTLAPPPAIWPSVVLPAVLIIGGSLAAAIWRFMISDNIGGASLLVGGLVLAAIPLVLSQRESIQRLEMQALATRVLSQRQRRKEVRSELENAIVELDRIGLRITSRPDPLGLPPMPEQDEAMNLIQQLSRKLDQLTKIEHHDELLGVKTDVQAKAEALAQSTAQARDAARSELAALQDEWGQWSAAAGIAGAMRPDEALDFFVKIADARLALADLATIKQEQALNAAEITAWEQRANKVLGDCGRECDQGGEEMITEFNSLRQDVETRHKLYLSIAEADRAIAAAGAPDQLEAVKGELASCRLEDLQGKVQSCQDQLQQSEEAYRQAIASHLDAVAMREALEQDNNQADLEFQSAALTSEIDSATAEWWRLRLAGALVEEALAEFERTHQPAVLARASSILSKVTEDRYQRVVPDQSGESIAVLNRSGTRQATTELSRGTQEQLYLAIRLGLVGELARQRVRLPLLMDDVLVNFDDNRAATMAQALHGFSGDHQILFFTCHHRVAEMLVNIDSEIRVLTLEVADLGSAAPVKRQDNKSEPTIKKSA